MKKILLAIIMITMSLTAVNTFAAGESSAPGPLVNAPLGEGTDLQTIFFNIMDVVQVIAIMITTLYLIYAGFMFVTAKGDPSRIKSARDALLWGLVGAALILTAEVIAYGIGDTVKEVFRGR